MKKVRKSHYVKLSSVLVCRIDYWVWANEKVNIREEKEEQSS